MKQCISTGGLREGCTDTSGIPRLAVLDIFINIMYPYFIFIYIVSCTSREKRGTKNSNILVGFIKILD